MSVDPTAPPATSSGVAAPGARSSIGGHTLDRVIGSGGTGVVWAGTDAKGCPVAIKLLRSGGSAAARDARLTRLRAVCAVTHANVATMLQVGSEGGRDYVIMERIEGQSVADWLALQPAPREVLATLLAAGRGLAAAHEAGVVHRNFTLHSVLRGPSGRVAVTDFGTALGQLDPAAEKTTSAVAVAAGRAQVGDGVAGRPPPRQQHALLDAALSQGGVFVGTPGYMAPELFTGAAPDARSDQFAFCVAAWEAFSGQRPFHGESLDELARAPVMAAPPGAASLSPGMHRVLARGLEADPARRWPDLPALLRELARAEPPPRGRALTLAASVVALACLVTLLALLRC
ncbi:MAG: serine/threonine protein kinase [Myxococcales bacterium]|nr:serine/threonine protein kinase [Myxococcales bacterium]